MTYPTDEEIRERVVKRIKARNEFYQHIIIYVAVNIFLWALWAFTGGLAGGIFPWPVFVTFGWGIGVAANAAEVFFGDHQQDVIEREVAREKARLYGEAALEKPKRRATLSDDGELVYEDESEDELPRRRSQAQ